MLHQLDTVLVCLLFGVGQLAYIGSIIPLSPKKHFLATTGNKVDEKLWETKQLTTTRYSIKLRRAGGNSLGFKFVNCLWRHHFV